MFVYISAVCLHLYTNQLSDYFDRYDPFLSAFSVQLESAVYADPLLSRKFAEPPSDGDDELQQHERRLNYSRYTVGFDIQHWEAGGAKERALFFIRQSELSPSVVGLSRATGRKNNQNSNF